MLSASTQDALEKVGAQTFDLMISDIGRHRDRYAGYTLLKALRSRGHQTPFIIYIDESGPELHFEALDKGAR
jgi:CheY-like chemotaxis protein